MSESDLPPFARGVNGVVFSPGQRGVKPRHAASLILLRQTAGGLEVLLGKRARQHRFLPDVYVFPGGRVDSTDLSDNYSNDLLQKDYLALSQSGAPARLARALAVAASRETWEETGLALGRVQDGRLCPDLTGLSYLGRAITPPQSPIRYHARFFAADAGRANGALRDSHELLDLAFRPLDQALRLPLADITEFMLLRLAELGPDLRHPRGTAFWSYRLGRPVVRWEAPECFT
ncbi:NUDIX hydrolase [Ferrovibrio sp.]|uniref:NUDIX hydrolase n=1 Tax=Ferrovibrio sp. TaxID=1917215 RepID=UPI0035B48A28